MEGPRPQKGSDILYQAVEKGKQYHSDPMPSRDEWWPAKVTKVDISSMLVSLVFFWTGGLEFRTDVVYDENKGPGTWRWP